MKNQPITTLRPEVLTSFTETIPTPEPILTDGQTLETVVHIKVPGTGVTIQSDLKWDIQVDNMTTAQQTVPVTSTEEVRSHYTSPYNCLHRNDALTYAKPLPRNSSTLNSVTGYPHPGNRYPAETHVTLTKWIPPVEQLATKSLQ
ncbi:hypothetical protein Bbelb_319410 [Branchiostoma belcheri]|nr:hypothetical protein Bbelb_319410 [Branchiostoma belcheri]